MDLSSLASGGMNAGSIEGAGTYFLGSKALTVGSNGLNSEVSGVIADGGTGGGVGGSLIKVSNGTLTLSGANTYTGGTTVNSGTLELLNGGSILGNVTNNATFSLVSSSAAGIEAITNNAGGLLSFSGGSTAAGASIINNLNGGTTFLDSSTAANASITNDHGYMVFYNSSTAANATITLNTGFVIFSDGSSAGSAAITNPSGVITFQDTASAANATIVNSNVIRFIISSTAGAAAITNNAGGSTTFQDSSNAGSAQITNNLGGLTTFQNSSNAGSAFITTNIGGLLAFQDASSAGTATVTTNNGSGTYFYGTSDGGQARFITNAGGIFDISNLTATGMNAGSIEGAGSYFLGSKALTVGSNGLNTEVNGVIADGGTGGGVGGSLIKVGAGTLTLSGANTYSGGTTLESGTLVVNNAQALGLGDMTVVGGVLMADPQPINVGGNYAQGPAGTLFLLVTGAQAGAYNYLNVTGNAALDGTLTLGNAGYNPSAGDILTLVKTGGTVSGKYATFNNPFTSGNGFNLVDLVYAAKTVELKFAEVGPTPAPTPGPPTPPTPPGPTPGPTPIVVQTVDFPSFAQTPNEAAIAGLLNPVQSDPKIIELLSFIQTNPKAAGLISAFQSNPKASGLIGSIQADLEAAGLSGFTQSEIRSAALVSYLFNQPVSNYARDLAIMSPEALSSLYEIAFSGAAQVRLTLDAHLDSMRTAGGGFNMASRGELKSTEVGSADGKAIYAQTPYTVTSPLHRWNVWATGFGAFVNVGDDASAKGYSFQAAGTTFGADYLIDEHFLIGVMGSYSHTYTSLSQGGHIGLDTFLAGGYASFASDGFYVNAGLFGGFSSFDTGRESIAGFANGASSGSELSAYLTTGYDFHVGKWTLGPLASLQYTYAQIDGFGENGSLSPMDIHSGSANSLRTDLGLRASANYRIGKVIVEPSAKVMWEHEYLYSALPITAGFADFPGNSATFRGPKEGADSIIVEAGVNVKWSHTLSTFLRYDGQLGRTRFMSNAITAGVSIDF